MVARGVRNNNPTNIRKGDNWDGLSTKQTDDSFCVFDDVKFGIRAFCKLILNYKKFYSIDTINGIVNRFAPSSENDTRSYVEHLCLRLGKKEDESLDLYNSEVMLELVKAVIKHECGSIPYSDTEIKAGMALAGIS